MGLEFKDCHAPLYVVENRNGRPERRQVNAKHLAEHEELKARQRLEEARRELDRRAARLRARGVEV